MRLQQLKVEYEPEQDRLLMLVATSEGMELRLSLTRRFVKLLWPLLVKLAEEASPRIRSQANPEARKALLGLEHEHAVSKPTSPNPTTRARASVRSATRRCCSRASRPATTATASRSSPCIPPKGRA
jgi:hypothetical protein